MCCMCHVCQFACASRSLLATALLHACEAVAHKQQAHFCVCMHTHTQTHQVEATSVLANSRRRLQLQASEVGPELACLNLLYVCHTYDIPISLLHYVLLRYSHLCLHQSQPTPSLLPLNPVCGLGMVGICMHVGTCMCASAVSSCASSASNDAQALVAATATAAG